MPPRQSPSRQSSSHSTATLASSASIAELLARIRSSIASIDYYSNGRDLTVGMHPCSLVTFDSDGYPSARTIVPLEIRDQPYEFASFRFYTRSDSRKVVEILRDKRVAIVFQDQRGKQGWVTVKGDARLERGTNASYPVDIIVESRKLEAVSYNEGLLTDAGTGQTPVVLVLDDDGKGWRRLS
mmetsp:Transcript_91580/g.262333  ORF Transcript_91580/g.262333 Transcript_91580/m.262333 type:complete len:183 (+) Transcript_91580:93-641(+)